VVAQCDGRSCSLCLKTFWMLPNSRHSRTFIFLCVVADAQLCLSVIAV
jgi:hypothetical protein